MEYMLILLLGSVSVLNGVPVSTYSTFDKCDEAGRGATKVMPIEYVCIPIEPPKAGRPLGVKKGKKK